MSIVRSVDEVWYKRAVEQHAIEDESFVYSVPYNTNNQGILLFACANRTSLSLSLFCSPDETMLDTSNLLVTASHSIFQKEDNKEAPVAVVGYQFQHSALHGLFKNITTNVSKRTLQSHQDFIQLIQLI